MAPILGVVADAPALRRLGAHANIMHWNRYYVLGWVAILITLAFYEFWAGWGPGRSTPMLTQITVRYCPWWVTMPFVTWLWIHFAIRYVDPKYIAHLRGQ